MRLGKARKNKRKGETQGKKNAGKEGDGEKQFLAEAVRNKKSVPERLGKGRNEGILRTMTKLRKVRGQLEGMRRQTAETRETGEEKRG